MTNGPNRLPTPRPLQEDFLTLFVPRQEGHGRAPFRRPRPERCREVPGAMAAPARTSNPSLARRTPLGERTLARAARFGLSPARISQKRREFCAGWRAFCGGADQ